MKLEDLSIEAVDILDRYKGTNPIPVALQNALHDFLTTDNVFVVNRQEVSPMEMLDVIYECLLVHNSKETAQ